MARTKQLEQDEPLSFARGILDTIIAKHDPEAVKETGRDAARLASGLSGGSKGGHARDKNLSAKKRRSPRKPHRAAGRSSFLL